MDDLQESDDEGAQTGTEEELDVTIGAASEDSSPEEPFDIRIPVTHTYLQSSIAAQLGEISAETQYLEPGVEAILPIIVMDAAVLLPGQTLPLQFLMPRTIEFVREAIRIRQYFALFTALLNEYDLDYEYPSASSSIGTLFQVEDSLPLQACVIQL